MINVKKFGIIAAIAILFGIFIFSLINAFYERPEYDDFCKRELYMQKAPYLQEKLNCTPIEVDDAEAEACQEQGGEFTPVYEQGCVKEFKCETCMNEYDEARENYEFFVFIMSSILGLLAVILSIYLPYKKDSLKERILTGFLIGGLIAIFVGTGRYFNDLHRILRPIIILIEIILVTFVAYKKIKK